MEAVLGWREPAKTSGSLLRWPRLSRKSFRSSPHTTSRINMNSSASERGSLLAGGLPTRAGATACSGEMLSWLKLGKAKVRNGGGDAASGVSLHGQPRAL